jgi:hypothetical protein
MHDPSHVDVEDPIEMRRGQLVGLACNPDPSVVEPHIELPPSSAVSPIAFATHRHHEHRGRSPGPSETVTVAPRCASAIASALPIPEPAPVMKMTLSRHAEATPDRARCDRAD